MPANQWMPSHKVKRAVNWILIVLGVLAFIAVCLACPVTRFIFKLDSENEQIPFSIEGWNSPMTGPDGTFTGTRLKMVDDLLNRYDFHGWSIIQVEQLLGKPVDRRQSWEQANVVKFDLRDGLNLLIFEVDSESRVTRYYVFRED